MNPFRRLCICALLWVVVACQHTPTGRPQSPYEITIDLRPLVSALGSADLEVQDDAQKRLLAYGPAVLPALVMALRTAQSVEQRITLVDTLQRLRVAEAVPPLIDVAAADPVAEVRYEALQSLGILGDARALAVVRQGLRDASEHARLGAVFACRALCNTAEDLWPVVDVALETTHPPLLAASRGALREGLADAARAEKMAAAIRSKARRAPPSQALQAALLLSDVGSADGQSVLSDAALSELHPQLRHQVVYALGEVADARAVATLQRLQEDPTISHIAYDALRRMQERGVEEAQSAMSAWRGRKLDKPVPSPLR